MFSKLFLPQRLMDPCDKNLFVEIGFFVSITQRNEFSKIDTKTDFPRPYALPKGHVSRLWCSLEANLKLSENSSTNVYVSVLQDFLHILVRTHLLVLTC